MAYDRINWLPRVVEKPRTYKSTTNADGTINLEKIDGEVLESGTPLTADNLNKMDKGIYDVTYNSYIKPQEFGKTSIATSDTTYKSTAINKCDCNVAFTSEILDANGKVDIGNMFLSGYLANISVSKLLILVCEYNNLTSIDVTNNINLINLYCKDNNLTNLDLSNNINLEILDCYYNNLTNLDLSNNINLINLYCNDNKLTSIDVSNNTNLTELHCPINNLTTLDVTNNINLKELHCQDNNLTNLDVTNNINLINLYCNNNKISNPLIIENFKNIEVVIFSNNLIPLIKFNNNPKLTDIEGTDGKLGTAELKHNPLLTIIALQHNKLTSLKIIDCGNLYDLSAHSNQLKELYLPQNNITNLNINQNPDLREIYTERLDGIQKLPEYDELPTEITVHRVKNSTFKFDPSIVSITFTYIDDYIPEA